MSEFHERIKEARLYFNLSQDDVAKATGLSQNAISVIEKGERKKINSDYLDFLVVDKGVSYKWLVHNKGNMFDNENSKYDTTYVEEIKQENSYLKQKIEKLEKRLEEQRLEFIEMIHKISGKQSEHKSAAFEFPIFGKSKSYVPATN